MNEWMQVLARHCEATRRQYPHDRLMIVFDIDGTILDMRHRILAVLRHYDRLHGSRIFASLPLGAIEEHENQLDGLLQRCEIPSELRSGVQRFFAAHFWDEDALREAHRPFRGVLEVMRWFQLQPRMAVGLNTGRPEALRDATLRSLNQLGSEWKLHFRSRHLVMNRYGPSQQIGRGKAEGMRELQRGGYRIFAFVDNEPENLAAVHEIDPSNEILLLHADTIFESARERLPSRAVSGQAWQVGSLVGEQGLPQHVEFVWRGIESSGGIQRFLNSQVHWAELDLRFDPARDELVASRVPLELRPLALPPPIAASAAIEQIASCDRALKLHLREGDELLPRLLALLDQQDLSGDQLAFSGSLEQLGEKGFRTLRQRHPQAVLQCPVDFLGALLPLLPDHAQRVLDSLRDWGIDRFCVDWRAPRGRRLAAELTRMGCDLELRGVPDLESFLSAALLLPRSISADFEPPDAIRAPGEPAKLR